MTDKEKDMKKVLFGNQKQANVINDSVVEIVSAYFESHKDPALSNEPLEDQVYTLIKEVCDKGTGDREDDMFIKLVCGVDSFNVLKSGIPYLVTADQPSIESPKYNFRIVALGEETAPEPEEADVLRDVGKPACGPDEVYEDDDDYATRARKIKDAILPMVPEQVKIAIPDNEWAQALCIAEYYYGFKG